jgi:hypothetical protein
MQSSPYKHYKNARHFSYQKAFKLFCLCNVNPVVFLNNFNMLHFIIKPVKRREMFPSFTKLTERFPIILHIILYMEGIFI